MTSFSLLLVRDTDDYRVNPDVVAAAMKSRPLMEVIDELEIYVEPSAKDIRKGGRSEKDFTDWVKRVQARVTT